MSATTKLAIAVTAIAIAGLSFTAVGIVSQDEARAQEANPTITITNEGATYTYSPDKLQAKAGQPITVTNNDPNGVHTVTAKDRTFNVDVPPKSSVTFTVSKAGHYDYVCTYHQDAHNPASIDVS
jgi:plastocyanin